LRDRTDVPFFLQRYPLYTNAQPGAQPVEPYASPDPVAVFRNGTRQTIGWCNLETWAVPGGVDVAVDPVLGRLVFADSPVAADAVTVAYTYVSSGDYGGGVYAQPVPDDEDGEPERVEFAVGPPALPGSGLAEVTDSGIVQGDLALSPSAGGRVVVRAGERQRPALTGDLKVAASAGSSVRLRGLGIGGTLDVSGEGPLAIEVQHCTIRGGIAWPAGVSGKLVVDHSLCGPVVANADVDVTIDDSAVDAGADTDPALTAGQLTVARSTIVGTIAVRTIPLLENSIVTGTVVSTERQDGCVRYAFVPAQGSQTPQRFRCQPDLGIAAALAAAPTLPVATVRASVEAWLQPAFTSRKPGDPAYLQLSDAAPDEIRLGAEDGDEMGVWYALFSTRRESNLRFRLNEYLRAGLEAGVIHAT
jgi:hypothetical protein